MDKPFIDFFCWVMGNQTFFTKSKILEKAVKPNLHTSMILWIISF